MAADKRCHRAAGAVLSFQVSFGTQDEIHHVIGEVVIAPKAVFAFEAVGEQEVNITVFCVAEDDCVGVAIGIEKLLQTSTGRSQSLHWDGDIF